MGIVEGGEGLLEPLSPAAVEVDDRAHAGRVHLGQVALDPLGRERRLAAAQMVVHVDDREGRLGDLGHLGDQHRPRLPVAEFQLLDVVHSPGLRTQEVLKKRKKTAKKPLLNRYMEHSMFVVVGDIHRN